MQFRPLTALAIFLLLGLIGGGAYLAYVNFSALSEWDRAKEALEVGDYQQAKEHLQRCVAHSYWSQSGEAHFLLARAHRRLGEFDEANEQLDEAEKLEWSPNGVEMERTFLRAQQGSFQDVEETLVRWGMEMENQDAAPVLEVLAEQYGIRLQLGAAVYWGKKFLEYAPRNVTALLSLGKIYKQGHNLPEALKLFRRAVSAQPEKEEARLQLASTLLEQKEVAKALEQYDYLSANGYRSRGVLLGLARCHVGLGHVDQARAILDDLVARYARDHEVLGERGRLALNQERRPAFAEKWLRESVKIYPYNRTTMHALYLCLKQQRDPAKKAEADKLKVRLDQLKQDLEKLDELTVQRLPKDPRNPNLMCEIAALAMRNGEEAHGVYWYNKALQIDPNHAAANRALADYYDKKGDKEQANRYRGQATGKSYGPPTPR
jgi:tetratricopeptide (TPR) repeat protein